MPKVSILIPCYNVEKYLKQCLDSVVNQTLKDIEIICINDGSTDTTLDILKEYQLSDNRIKIISKDNSGYGDSMNKGLEMSTGEYIGIIESDDLASLNMFENLYALANKYDVNVVKSNWYEYRGITNSTTITNRFDNLPKEKPISPLVYKDLYVIPSLIASCLYKREYLIKYGIKFLTTPGASYQDTAFAAKTVMTADKIVLTDDCYYYYRTDNSASSVKQKGKVFCICEEYASINSYMDKYSDVKSALEQQKCANQFREYLWNYNRLDKSVNSDFLKRFREEFKNYYDNNVLKEEFYSFYSKELVELLVNNPKKFAKKIDERKKQKFISISKEGNHKLLKILGKTILKVNFRKHFSWYYLNDGKRQFKKILKEHKTDMVFVMSPFIPYYSPMKQRFQHLAEQLANKGVLVFYCTNYYEDREENHGGWKYFKKINNNLYLSSCFNMINNTLKNGWFYYTPISPEYSEKDFKLSKQNNKIVYDHIDSFNVGANKERMQKFLVRHKQISPLCDIILHSSKKLKEDFNNISSNKVLNFIPNGVDYEHFADVSDKKIPQELIEVVSQGKKIIGTHGALTISWIDFELIDKTAKVNKDKNIVLIGSTYLEEDKIMLDKILAGNKNIYYIPAVSYKELPQYTKYFDVAIIPFKHGEIALNTNPIKLFENMAMGIPTVVTKDLVECKGYQGVFVSENDEEFLQNIDIAFKTKDKAELKETLRGYAKTMTWEKQAQKLLQILNH